jgi:cullin 3
MCCLFHVHSCSLQDNVTPPHKFKPLCLPLHVQVLTTGSWPTQAASKCVLPAQLESACEKFKEFYTNAHNGRRLAWQTNMGTADLKATFNNGKAKHEITVSAPSMHGVCCWC